MAGRGELRPGGAAKGGAGQRRPLALRHPRATLAVAGVCAVVLGVIGLGVEERLRPTSLRIPGTESAKASEMLQEHFGDSAPFAVLLQGPADEIDRQGPALILALRQNPEVTTVSPWDRGGGVEELRQSPDEALILVDYHLPIDEAVDEAVPELEGTVEERISPPVVATTSGFASISKAIQEESIDSTRRGELIALPILMIVLLLVFRSPVAAAIPLLFGAMTVLVSRGLLVVLTGFVDIDAFALAVSSMMGLALGVDYALLTVSRFREELAGGASAADAAWTTRRTAGRTTIFAGTTLLIAMAVAALLLPGSLLVSLAGTVVLVTGVAVVSSSFVGPALLALLGQNINRWHTAGGSQARPAWLLAVTAAMQRPRLVGSVIALGLLFLAAPALGLETGPPSTEQLPRSDPARQSAERIRDAMGPGWNSPFILVAESDEGPVTEPARLKAINRWQRLIAERPGVEAVIGPGEVAERVSPLRRLGLSLLGADEGDEMGSLTAQLARATAGVRRVRSGLAEAARGSAELHAGGSAAAAGSDVLAAGLTEATEASTQATDALERFASGTRQLAAAQQKALLGALAIKFGTADLGKNLRANPLPRAQRLDKGLTDDSNAMPQLQGPAGVAESELEDAWAQLQGMGIGTTDPNHPAAVAAVREALGAVSGTYPDTLTPYASGYDGLPAELAALRGRMRDYAIDADEILNWLNTIDNGLERLRRASARLYDGLLRIRRATKQLAAGAGTLSRAAPGLTEGLTELGGGAGTLAGGLGALSGGLDQLQRALVAGYWRTRPLASGVRRANIRITTNRRRLNRNSPGLFDSGYFVLSALDGAEPSERNRIGQAVDLDGSGQAALILAIPAYGFNTAGSTELNGRLREDAEGLAEESGLRTAVAGGAAQLSDYDQATSSRIPLVIAAISLITFLALILILRALPLAAIAVGLNLVTVAAAFGVLCALFAVPEGLPFGGTDFIDAVGAAAIFGVVFGLSIDYAVFLLMRMRESWEAGDGSEAANEAAINYGLERTAGVITGAAAIMAAVFMAYAIAPISTVSQFGIGLTVAVLLDATVIRLILLPILMRLIGPRVWWLPPALERAMPRVRVEGKA